MARLRAQRSALALLCAAFAPDFASNTAWAQTEAQTRRFDIPAQPLASALLSFARQARVEVFASEVALDDLRSSAVAGELTPSAALARLLGGTGYEGRIVAGRVRLAPAGEGRLQPQPTTPPQPRGLDYGEISIVGVRAQSPYSRAFPSEIFTASDIEASGASSVAAFLRGLTQSLDTRSQYGVGGLSVTNSEAVNGLDWRGLGPGATLVLINGRRTPLASDARTSDLSFVPLGAIERIEILSDGPSALYGADAVAGVVNIVLRQAHEGQESEIALGAASDGALYAGRISHSAGVFWAEGSAFLSLSSESQSALDRRDRDFAQNAGRGDLAPADTRLSLAGALALDVTERLRVSGELMAGARDTQSDFEFPTASTFVAASAEAGQMMAGIGAQYDVKGDWTFHAGLAWAQYESSIRQRLIWASAARSVASDTDHRSLEANLGLSGSFRPRGGQPWRAALGLGRFSEDLKAVLTHYEARRTMDYAYGELRAPWTIGAHAFELTLSGRYTHYGDDAGEAFGDRLTPKLGLSWALHEGLLVRAGYGESFRAPALIELDPSGAINVIAPAPIGGSPALVLGVFGPSGSLQAERAGTTTLGLEWAPSPFWRASVNLFDIAYRGRVATPDPTGGLAPFANPLAFSDLVYTTDDVELIAQLLASTTNAANLSGVDLGAPDAAQGLAAISNFYVFDNRVRNLEGVRVQGLDADFRFEAQTRYGLLSLGARLTHLFRYDEQVTPNGPNLSVLDTFARPVDWRARAFVGIIDRGRDLRVGVNFVDGYRNPYASVFEIDRWVTWDGRLAWDFAQEEGRGFSLALNLLNIFDEPPPYVEASSIPGLGLRTAIGFDPTNANPIGRFIGVELRRTW